jgi:alpha-tubulin suppressor-like RCC1 family protein
MAFTNKCQNQVTISLRGPKEGAPETNAFAMDAGERAGWTYQEAAFYGNLFADTPDRNACDGAGSNAQVQLGLGRECGSDDKSCGFKAQGACASDCTISTNGDKYYKSCSANGRTYSRVVTTYLDPATWRGAMDCRNKGLEDDQLSVGPYHACVRKPSGQLVCWGYNVQGQVGDGTSGNLRYVATAVQGLANAVQVNASDDSTCARKENGAIVCWGDNAVGQLGDGTTAPSLAPVTVKGVANAVHVSGGREHTCVRTAAGKVFCWGSNYAGQLGSTAVTAPLSSTPVSVTGISDAVEVATGEFHSCARRADNTVWCWGSNFYGQLGDGTSVDSRLPVQVPGITDAVQVTAGFKHTCVRRLGGGLLCWGDGGGGQLGDGAANARVPTPVQVQGFASGATKVTAGAQHTCATKADGKVYCWGSNYFGELGDGTTVTRAVPTLVVDLADANDVGAGIGFTCARRAAGGVACWGKNPYGQLGRGGSDYDAHPRPELVVGSQ